MYIRAYVFVNTALTKYYLLNNMLQNDVYEFTCEAPVISIEVWFTSTDTFSAFGVRSKTL